MRLPSPLSRRNARLHKNDFGHVLVLAGSSPMLGAAALTGLSAMSSGAGLTTIGVPKSLNTALQKKISPVIMSWPLPETRTGSLSIRAFKIIETRVNQYQAMALGPGLSRETETQKLVSAIIRRIPLPMVIDGDALSAVSLDVSVLNKNPIPKILTPHPGEMSRLTGLRKETIEKSREKVAKEFSRQFGCILVLKGHHTVITSPEGKIKINRSGNVGLATAGSGDVLTGMIASFLAQGIEPFLAAVWGVYLHGLAGDLASKQKTKVSLIATDIIDFIPTAVKKVQTHG